MRACEQSSFQEKAIGVAVPAPALIEVEDLGVSYRGKPALEGVSLSIARGCITSLIGPSGCGKTSFLICLNRLTDLIDGCRVQGRARLGSLDLRSSLVDVRALRRRVGMVFQKPNPFPLSIYRNLDLPLRDLGIRRRQDREERVEAALRDVGLWREIEDRLHAPAMSLSGGQQQRLCIARAIVLEPEVLLMDEPCSSLDPLSAEVVEDLMLGLRNRFTILVVTHNLAQARRISDYTAMFWLANGCGRLVEEGTTTEIFERPRQPLTEAYVRGKRG